MSLNGNGTSPPQDRPSQPRAVDACSVHAHGPTDIRAGQAERTSTSERAAEAYQDWSLVPDGDRPLVKHRAAHARLLFDLLRDHACSRSWFALQIGVNEKQVRKMLKAEIAIPSTVSSCMPIEMRADYIERLGRLDGVPVASLGARIDRLYLDDLADVIQRANARILYLAKSGK